ncbi:MAG: hypothetical protein JXR85_02100 [Deltaproteobacteria bacterium]|nr:hypothetical protein [Deltaproteobacteria bacterium]
MNAVDTFFGSYVNFWTDYDHVSLLLFLDSLNDLEEALQEEHGLSLQVFAEYVPLDAIRNYWHRHDELRNRIVLAQSVEIPGVHTDFNYLCLIDASTMSNVIDAIDEEYREEDRQTIDETVHYYGNIINLGHILFNITSLTMHKLLYHGIEGTSKEFGIAKEILRSDPSIGKPITFSGWFEGEPGLVCAFIDTIYRKALK